MLLTWWSWTTVFSCVYISTVVAKPVAWWWIHSDNECFIKAAGISSCHCCYAKAKIFRAFPHELCKMSDWFSICGFGCLETVIFNFPVPVYYDQIKKLWIPNTDSDFNDNQHLLNHRTCYFFIHSFIHFFADHFTYKESVELIIGFRGSINAYFVL